MYIIKKPINIYFVYNNNICIQYINKKPTTITNIKLKIRVINRLNI